MNKSFLHNFFLFVFSFLIPSAFYATDIIDTTLQDLYHFEQELAELHQQKKILKILRKVGKEHKNKEKAKAEEKRRKIELAINQKIKQQGEKKNSFSERNKLALALCDYRIALLLDEYPSGAQALIPTHARRSLENFSNWAESHTTNLFPWEFNLLNLPILSYIHLVRLKKIEEQDQKATFAICDQFLDNQLSNTLKMHLFSQCSSSNRGKPIIPAHTFLIKTLLKQDAKKFIEATANYYIAKYYYLPYYKIKDGYKTEEVKEALQHHYAVQVHKVAREENHYKTLQGLQSYIEKQYRDRNNHGYDGAKEERYRSNHGGVHVTLASSLLYHLWPWYASYWPKKELEELEKDNEMVFLLIMAVLFHDAHNTEEYERKNNTRLNTYFFEYEMHQLGLAPKKIKAMSDALAQKDDSVKKQSLYTALIHDCDALEIPRTFSLSKQKEQNAINDTLARFDVVKLTIYSYMEEKIGAQKTKKEIQSLVVRHTRVLHFFMKDTYEILNTCQKSYDKTYTKTIAHQAEVLKKIDAEVSKKKKNARGKNHKSEFSNRNPFSTIITDSDDLKALRKDMNKKKKNNLPKNPPFWGKYDDVIISLTLLAGAIVIVGILTFIFSDKVMTFFFGKQDKEALKEPRRERPKRKPRKLKKMKNGA